MKYSELSFTRQRDDGTTDAWSPKVCGVYEEDWKRGKTYFEELIAASPSPAQVSHVLYAMIEKGKITGVEAGFVLGLSLQAT